MPTTTTLPLTPQGLLVLADEKRSVIAADGRHPGWARKPISAAFVVNMPFDHVLRALPQIKAYERRPPK